jgi:hypothetical protein
MPSYESSMRNLEKAGARWPRPRPLRSSHESRMIRRFAFQWFTGGRTVWPGLGPCTRHQPHLASEVDSPIHGGSGRNVATAGSQR